MASKDSSRDRVPVIYKGQRVDGLWQRRTADGAVRFDAVTKIDGRTVKRVLNAVTVTDAIRERQALVAGLHDRPRTGADVTFAQARDAYIEQLSALAKTGERSQRSPGAAAARLRRLDRLDPLTMRQITSPDLAAALHDLRQRDYSAWSIKTTVAAFQACWTFAARERGWCDEAARPRTASIQITGENARQPRRLNDGQLHDLIVSATDRGRPLVALLAFTGLRLSEALALTWDHVDLVDGRLHVERQMGEDGRPTSRLKAESSRRTVPLPAPLRHVLTDVLREQVAVGRGNPTDPVLMSARLTHFTKRRAAMLFSKAVKHSGLGDVVPHDCRYSYGSLLIEKGVPITTVSRLLGHSSPATTMRIYADIVEGRERETHALIDAVFGDHPVTTVGSGDHAGDHDAQVPVVAATENPLFPESS